MHAEYNYWMLLGSLITCSLSMMGVFSLFSHLYRSPTQSRNVMLAVFSAIAGTGLWLNHLLIEFSTFSEFHPHSSLEILILGWFLAIGIAYAVLSTASQKELKAFRFICAALAGALLTHGMFLTDWLSNMAYDQFHFEPVQLTIAIFISILVVTGNVLVFFWVKHYNGPYHAIIKFLLGFMLALSIVAIHITYNQAFVSNSPGVHHPNGYNKQEMVGITIALAIVCLFSMAFAATLLYEKLQNRRILQQLESDDLSSDQIPLDPLTQLPNRKAFDLYLGGAPKRSVRGHKTFAVAYIDLDHFKPINDQFGHHVGDAVLAMIAQRLDSAIRGCDFAARIGGDEFAVLFEEIITEEDIIPIAQRIIESVKEPFWALGHLIDISCSIGIAVYPRDGDIKSLMQNADAAMYKSKEAGKNQFKFFDKEIEAASKEMQTLQADIQAALDERQFSLVFQPKVDCVTLSPIGAEALIRWQHPRKGEIRPQQFLAASERFGLIGDINHWVLEECCRTLAKANREHVDLRLSMNLSAQQFRGGALVDDITKMLKKYHLRSDQLIFEIKDTSEIRNKKQFLSALSAFKAANIKVSLDDFGSQSFSLDSLQNLEVSEVKLDKTFISKIDKDKITRGLLDAMIRLAQTLGLNIVACGVESEAQLQILRKLGCNQIQGYLFSKPVTQDKLIDVFNQLYVQFENTGRFNLSDYQAQTE